MARDTRVDWEDSVDISVESLIHNSNEEKEVGEIQIGDMVVELLRMFVI